MKQEGIEALIDELGYKLVNAAARMGFDPANEQFIERMARIALDVPDSETGTSSKEWNAATWPERALAIGFQCAWDDADEEDSNDEENQLTLIQSLCLGNWCVGFLDGLPGNGDQDINVQYNALQEQASRRAFAKKGGEAAHAKSGYREKKMKILEIWASGKYDNRDLCAEQECAAIGMSFSTARKALRGTPDPAR